MNGEGSSHELIELPFDSFEGLAVTAAVTPYYISSAKDSLVLGRVLFACLSIQVCTEHGCLF